MKPAARIAATIEVLTLIEDADRPPDVVIDEYFKNRRYAGSGDRRDISARVYEVMRRRAKLDWWLERTASPLARSPRVRTISYLILEERLAPDETAQRFDGGRHAPTVLSPDEASLTDALYGRSLIHPDMPDHVRFEYPEWMDRSFRALWGERLPAEMSALNQPAPVDLRVNTLKTRPEDALNALRQEFVDCEPTPLSPIGIRLSGRARLAGTQAFKNGLVDVQDEGSQLVSLLADAKPGMTVIDLCAGAGGKTLALAASMGQSGEVTGRLHALDVSKYRLDRMVPRLKRAGAMAVRRRVIAAKDDDWLREQSRRADRVIADVPCTGTGSWRRNPDARWQFSPEDLDALVATQRDILKHAVQLLKPNGRLIYVTCSLLQEENEKQIDWLVSEHDGLDLIPVDDVWVKTVGGPPPEQGPTLRLSPASTGTDGFYCAIINKSS